MKTHMLIARGKRWDIVRNTLINRLLFSWWCYTYYGTYQDCLMESYNF